MELLLLVVGDNKPRPSALERLRAEAAVSVRALPADLDRGRLDPVLDELGERRLAVAADLAGLHRVIVRLLRRDQLAAVAVGVAPAAADALGDLGLTAEQSLRGLLAGASTPRSLVRDDHADVLLTTARLRSAADGVPLGVRAYVDEHELANDFCSDLVVAAGPSGLEATATPAPRRWPRRGRPRTIAGRAVTLSCEDARLTIDGIEQPRAITRRTWWHEPDRWRVYTG